MSLQSTLLSGLAMRHGIYGQPDPRVKDWMLVGDPFYPIFVLGGYLLFVYVVGPWYMKNREPYDLRWAIRLHNLFMVITNSFFFVEFIRTAYKGSYNPFCQGMTYATDPASLRMVELGWWFFLARTPDLLDTIFFVLRKKYDHVTFQHVSHHFCCLFSGHIFLTLGLDGQSWFGISLNSGIHVVMYSYYFLASYGPHMKPYLWWKRYLTMAQIVQHYLIIIHGVIPVFYDCGYPSFLIKIAMPQGILGLFLFINFYALAYTGKKSWSDVFSAAPCILSDDNDPMKFKRLQKDVDDMIQKESNEDEDGEVRCRAKQVKED